MSHESVSSFISIPTIGEGYRIVNTAPSLNALNYDGYCMLTILSRRWVNELTNQHGLSHNATLTITRMMSVNDPEVSLHNSVWNLGNQHRAGSAIDIDINSFVQDANNVPYQEQLHRILESLEYSGICSFTITHNQGAGDYLGNSQTLCYHIVALPDFEQKLSNK